MAAYVQALLLGHISIVVSLVGPTMDPLPLRPASALMVPVDERLSLFSGK